VVSSTPRPHFTPGKNPLPILQVADWAPGPVWTSEENFVPNGIRSPVRPALSLVAMPTELHGPYIYIIYYILNELYILHINMYIKDRFKPIFHFFLHKNIRNLKLPQATVHFAPPPPPPHSVINQICYVVLKLLTPTDICHTTTQKSAALRSAHIGSPF
jgi:hypothetical protein